MSIVSCPQSVVRGLNRSKPPAVRCLLTFPFPSRRFSASPCLRAIGFAFRRGGRVIPLCLVFITACCCLPPASWVLPLHALCLLYNGPLTTDI